MAFLPLPDMEILLPLTSGLAVGRNGAGLSPHIVGAFELLGQAQYPQERREVLRGNLLKGYLQLIAKFVDQHFYIAALMDTLSERLSKEDYTLVEELREQVAIAQCEENESHFKYGFSAGLLVQQEAHAQVAQKNKE